MYDLTELNRVTYYNTRTQIKILEEKVYLYTY